MKSSLENVDEERLASYRTWENPLTYELALGQATGKVSTELSRRPYHGGCKRTPKTVTLPQTREKGPELRSERKWCNCSEGCSSRETGSWTSKGLRGWDGNGGTIHPIFNCCSFFFSCPTNVNVTQDSVLGWKLTKVKALWVSNNRKSLQLA